MKKIFIIVFLLFGISLLSGCTLIEKIEVEEYQAYLESKYGKDKGFYMVEEYRCNWFELGTCSYLFSSNDLNGETFQIVGEVNGGENIFTETYIGAKYNNRLEDYYKNLLGSSLNFNYTIDFIPNYESIDPEITFDDYLKYDDLNLYISIRTYDENINIQQLRTTISSIIMTNQIKNIDTISLVINDNSDECDGGCNNYHALYER